MPKQDEAMKPDDKSVSRSVSMLQSMWDLIDAYAPSTPGKDRSGYLQSLAEADLRSAGFLPEAGSGDHADFVKKVTAGVIANPRVKKSIEKLLAKSEGQRRMAAAGSR